MVLHLPDSDIPAHVHSECAGGNKCALLVVPGNCAEERGPRPFSLFRQRISNDVTDETRHDWGTSMGWTFPLSSLGERQDWPWTIGRSHTACPNCLDPRMGFFPSNGCLHEAWHEKVAVHLCWVSGPSAQPTRNAISHNYIKFRPWARVLNGGNAKITPSPCWAWPSMPWISRKNSRS